MSDRVRSAQGIPGIGAGIPRASAPLDGFAAGRIDPAAGKVRLKAALRTAGAPIIAPGIGPAVRSGDPVPAAAAPPALRNDAAPAIRSAGDGSLPASQLPALPAPPRPMSRICRRAIDARLRRCRIGGTPDGLLRPRRPVA